MSDLPLQGLFEQLRSRHSSGEHLEVLGKQAAADWCEGRHATLTEAVTASVKHAQISAEQVRRVVEFANTEAFNAEFRKQGSTHRVVSFAGGPADASTIIKDLNSGGGSSTYSGGLSDYHNPPTTKVSSVAAEQALLSSFMSRETFYPMESPHAEALDLRDKLASVHDQMTSELSGLEIMYGDLKDYLFNEVKQASMAGTSLGEMVQAWEGVTPAPKDQFIKAAFLFLSPRLLENEVFRSPSQMQHSLEKVGQYRITNREHPLVSYYSEFCECLSKMAEARAARDSFAEPLAELNRHLRKQAGLWDRWSGMSHELGGGVGRGLEHLVAGTGLAGAGDTAGKVTKAGLKYGLPLAAGYSALKSVEQSTPYQLAAAAMSPNMMGTQQYYNNNYGAY